MESNVDEESKNGQPRAKRIGGYKLKRNAKGETELHVAIIRNLESQVESLLSKGHPVNEKDNGGWFPLHEACNYGRIRLVELLLGIKGINIDAEGGGDKVTPMMDAAENGYYDVVEMLLNKGASVTKFDRRNRTILDYLKNRADRVDETLSDERHRLQLIKFVEDEMKNKNFAPPERFTTNEEKNLKRSEILNNRKRQRIEAKRNTLTKYDDNPDVDNLSADQQNAKNYHKTIARIGKSALQRRLPDSFELFDADKPSLIPEEDFEVQEDWLDDDLNLFNKKKGPNPRLKRPLSFSSSDDDDVASDGELFDSFNEPSTSDVNETPSTSNANSIINDLYDQEIEENDDVDYLGIVHRHAKTSAFVERQKRRKLRQTKLTPVRNVILEQEIRPIHHKNNTELVTNRLLNVTHTPINVATPPLNVQKSTKIVVKIEGRKFLVPILDSDLDKNIGWLANQAALRYGSNHGRKPRLRLLNANEVEIGINDAVNLFFDEELVAEVINWDLSPLHAKYEEICKNLNGIMYTNLKTALRSANETNELILENSGCKGSTAMHVFKTIQDGYSLTLINLRGNRLSVDNVKDLGVALVLLKSLKVLSLRNTGLANEHLHSLNESLQSTGDAKIASLQNLDLSYNLFDDNAKECLEKILRCAPLLAQISLICIDFSTINVAGLSIVK